MANKYYEKLGLKEDASLEEAKKNFHLLAKKYHPDNFLEKNEKIRQFALEQFREINEAYNYIRKNAGLLKKEHLQKEATNDEKAFDEFLIIYPKLKKELDRYNIKVGTYINGYLNVKNRGKIPAIKFEIFKKRVETAIQRKKENNNAFDTFQQFYMHMMNKASKKGITLNYQKYYIDNKNRGMITPEEFLQVQQEMAEEYQEKINVSLKAMENKLQSYQRKNDLLFYYENVLKPICQKRHIVYINNLNTSFSFEEIKEVINQYNKEINDSILKNKERLRLRIESILKEYNLLLSNKIDILSFNESELYYLLIKLTNWNINEIHQVKRIKIHFEKELDKELYNLNEMKQEFINELYYYFNKYNNILDVTLKWTELSNEELYFIHQNMLNKREELNRKK